LGCVGHAFSANFRTDISTAEEETVDGVGGGGLAGCGVVEFGVAGGVGGKGREEGVDIGTVEAILGEGSVCTEVVEVILGSYMSRGQVEEDKHGKEHEGKRKGIEGMHFDEPILQDFRYCFGASIYMKGGLDKEEDMMSATGEGAKTCRVGECVRLRDASQPS